METYSFIHQLDLFSWPLPGAARTSPAPAAEQNPLIHNFKLFIECEMPAWLHYHRVFNAHNTFISFSLSRVMRRCCWSAVHRHYVCRARCTCYNNVPAARWRDMPNVSLLTSDHVRTCLNHDLLQYCLPTMTPRILNYQLNCDYRSLLCFRHLSLSLQPLSYVLMSLSKNLDWSARLSGVLQPAVVVASVCCCLCLVNCVHTLGWAMKARPEPGCKAPLATTNAFRHGPNLTQHTSTWTHTHQWLTPSQRPASSLVS